MLMLCLITTCAISGTFAKYTTSANATDTARVAKWGIVLTVSDTNGSTLFAEEYEAGNITVVSQHSDDVVAPGTKNETGITFTIDGKPEVATKVTASLGATKDVFIKYDSDSNGSLDATYYPVVFTLTHTYGTGANSIASAATAVGLTVDTSTPGTDVIKGTLADIQKVLVKLTENMTHNNPGYIYDSEFTLTWAWDFDTVNSNHTLDTMLGNIEAGILPGGVYTANDYCTDLTFNFSITVEQVD
ncbi:MAG: hypothetical protein J6M16_01850 [Clostridia bacterium]|nr:hypothetical protein [Clostridia bacterium]